MAASLRVGGAAQGVPVVPSQDHGSLIIQSGRLKGRNFIPEEECQLCKSVLHVFQDPRIAKKVDPFGSVLPLISMMLVLQGRGLQGL
jgi:hypothetical protein